MTITNSVTKKVLEKIVLETFKNFGLDSTCYLLDNLKFLGFHYATSSGLSISINDLKIPKTKQLLLDEIQNDASLASNKWDIGYLSELERFNIIFENWTLAAESLKEKILEFYQEYDPLNNLYIMAFSGARGNMSQVRQLVGMRGLMSDHAGNIINIPIQSSFREGLTSIDYIISSYGARKGVVDTALKTAEAGYLTRRLVFVAQDLIIKDFDCKTNLGLGYYFEDKLDFTKLLGRVFLKYKALKLEFNSREHINFLINVFGSDSPESFLLNEDILKKMEIFLPKPSILVFRSPLTCSSLNTICQKCYGADSAENKNVLVEFGKPIGTIAAQSIGEPGTQLTMRTFHTGGVFSGEFTTDHILSPFSGKLIFPKEIKFAVTRTSKGVKGKKLLKNIQIILNDSKNKKYSIEFKKGNFLYSTKNRFVAKNEILGEPSVLESENQKLKSIYAPIDCQVFFGFSKNSYASEYSLSLLDLIENEEKKEEDANDFSEMNLLDLNLSEKFYLSSRINSFSDYKYLGKDGLLWLISGRVLNIPKEAYNEKIKRLIPEKSFARLSLVSPINGVFIASLEENFFWIFKEKTTKKSVLHLYSKVFGQLSKNSLEMNLENFEKISSSFSTKIVCLKKNFEKIEKNSIIAYIYIFPIFRENFSLITKKDINEEIQISDLRKFQILGQNRNLLSIDEAYNSRQVKKIQNWLIKERIYHSNLIDKPRKYSSAGDKSLFFVGEKDIWKIESDNPTISYPEKTYIKASEFLNSSTQAKLSGKLLKKDGFKMIFHRFLPVYFNAGTYLKCGNTQFLKKDQSYAKVFTSTFQTSDIVQGLPKIERLIEATNRKDSTAINYFPGVFLRRQHFNASYYEILNKINNAMYQRKIRYEMSFLVKFRNFSSFLGQKKLFFRYKNIDSSNLIPKISNIFRLDYKHCYQFLISSRCYLSGIGWKTNILKTNQNFFVFKNSILPKAKVLNNIKLSSYINDTKIEIKAIDISLEKNQIYKATCFDLNSILESYSSLLLNSDIQNRNFSEIFTPISRNFCTEQIRRILESHDPNLLYLYKLDPLTFRTDKWLKLGSIVFGNNIFEYREKKNENRDNLPKFCFSFSEIIEDRKVKNNFPEDLDLERFEYSNFQELYYSLADGKFFLDIKKVEKFGAFPKKKSKIDKKTRFLNNHFRYSSRKKKKIKSKKSNLNLELVKNFSVGQFVDLGYSFLKGVINSNDLLEKIFKYYFRQKLSHSSILSSTTLFQLLWVKALKAIYKSQGVEISEKQLEIIIKQMTGKVEILLASSYAPFFPSERYSKTLILQICREFLILFNDSFYKVGEKDLKSPRKMEINSSPYRIFSKALKKKKFKFPEFKPFLLSCTRASLEKSGFFVNAGFQETKTILMRAAIEGKKDWLLSLKESVISGRLLPIGTSVFNKAKYLNNFYYYKKNMDKNKKS